MSVTSANLLTQAVPAVDHTGIRIEDTWRVYTDDANTPYGQIIANQYIPAMYQPHPVYSSAVVQGKSASLVSGTQRVWDVTVAYGVQTGDPDQDRNQVPNPLLRPVRRRSGTVLVERFLDKDLSSSALQPDGKPFLNSANVPLDPPQSITIPHVIATFIRNEASYSLSAQLQYAGRVNSAQFGAIPQYHCRCNRMDGVEMWETDPDGNTLRYWEVTYEFEYSPYPWHPLERLNIGYMQRDTPTSELTPCVDDDGNQVTEPCLLDALGKQIKQPSAGVETYEEFQVYRFADFNSLGLPID